MDFPNPIVRVPVTPEYVLAWFRDYIRLDPDLGGPEEGALLTFDSTVREWMSLCGIRWNRTIHQRLNRQFGIRSSWHHWRAVLNPPSQRTFRGICNLISLTATRPGISAVHLGPFSCRAAGAFIAVREFLRDQGADANQIAPSTLLAPYIWKYENELQAFFSTLAPGAIPEAIGHFHFRERVLRWIAWGVFCFSIAQCSQSFWEGLIVAFIALIIAIIGSPRDLSFGTLRTFRDLSIALAAENGD